MKNKSFSILLFGIIGAICILSIIYANKNNNSMQNSTNIAKLSAEITTNTEMSNDINNIEFKETSEEELSSFSTKLSGRDTPRSRNIALTCSILNETIIESNQVFSFNSVIGNPTAENGYEKAKSFDADGKTVQTYGGGNCQVSSTLYNVVLQVPEQLEVVERHKHVKPVHYVEENKDATVSYGSVDFKFKNNTTYPIKIYANSNLSSVDIRIVKLYN